MNYKVINLREEPGVDDHGKPTAFIRVEFQVGTQGPFVERFSKATFNQSEVSAKLTQFAQHVLGIVGS